MRKTVSIPDKLVKLVEEFLATKSITFDECLALAIEEHLEAHERTLEDLLEPWEPHECVRGGRPKEGGK